MKTIICFVLFILSLSLAGQTVSSKMPEELSAYIQRPLYSFNYPSSWKVDTSKIMGTDLLLSSPKAETIDSFMENLTVYTQDLSGQGYNLSKMGRESEQQIMNLVTNLEILESRFDSSSSQQYYVLKYKGRQGKFLLTTEQRFFFKNEIGFAFTFTTEQGKEETYQPIYSLVFDSIKLL